MEIPQSPAGELEQPAEKPRVPKAKLIGIGIVIAVVVAAVVYLAYFNHSSSPAPVNTNNAYVSRIYSDISSTPLTLQKMAAATSEALNYVNSSNEFAVNYTGSVKLGMLSQLTGSINMNFTFDVAYQKYGNDSRIDFKGQNLPILGNFSASVFQLTKQAYICTDFNPASMLSILGSSPSNSSAPSIKCYSASNGTSGAQSSLSSLNVSPQYLLSYSSSISNAVSLTNPKVTQATYNGYTCTLLTTNISITNVSKLLMPAASAANSSSPSVSNLLSTAKNTTVTTTGPIKICYSTEYAIPVYISTPSISISTKSAAGNSTVSVAITLTAAKVSLQTNKSYVSTLTGPIANSSSMAAYPTTPGNPGNPGNQSMLPTLCKAEAGYSCINPVLYSSTDTLSVSVGQVTGATWYAPSGTSGVPFYLAPSNVTFTGPSTPGIIASAISISSMDSGQLEPVIFNNVFGTSSISPGTQFSGSIYAAYSTSQGGYPQYMQIATVTVKST